MFFKKKYLRRILDRIQALEQRISLEQRFSNIAQSIAYERFYHNQNACDCGDLVDFSDNHFVIFNYPYHFVGGYGNLGDEIQSIATKNALDSIYPNATYEYFGRDYLAYYNATALQNGGGGGNRRYAGLVCP